ncbi:hypothetical protein TYRP_016809 [Tyrophagus putrescentiae]|nr:hypothetical protein TYRP_016809 [Tyrophagus putrescentiae]
MDGTLSELQSLDPKLQQEVDHNLAYQMQLEMDRDPRALAYFYSAHGKEKGGDAAAKLRASGSKAKSKSLQSSSTDDVSAREKKIIKAICASSLVEMQQGLPSTSSSSTSTLTPGPTFENTSLVKSSKFLARLAGEDCGNDDDDDDNDEEEEEDDDTMGEEYEDYGGSGGDSGNEEEEEEDDEPIETDDAEVNAERQRRAMERMGGKRKGGPPSKVHISDYVRLGLSGGKQPRRRPPPLAGASVGAVASSQRRLHRQKLRTIVPPSNNAKTATKTATTSGKQQQTAGESSSKKVVQVAPINGDDDDDEDDDELSFLIGRGEEATEEEARAQAIEEARMKQEQRGLTSNQQSGSSSHHHRQQDPSRAWAVEYNGEYAGDFDEALRAALAASMETATIEQQQHHGSMSVGGGSSIDDHHNYHQKAPEHQLQAPGYSRDSYYSTLPPPPTSPSTTANDNSSSHALQTLCAIAVNDENREPSTSSKQPQQQPLFSGLSLPGARPRSRGMYNLQLHHHQSHLMNAGSDEGGKDGSKENAEDTVTGARKAATTIIKTSGGGEGKTSGAHANKVRFAARENVIPYPGSSSTSTTSPLAGDTFSAAVASVSPSTSASTSTAAFTNRGHYPDLLLSNRALSTFSSSSHPFVCFLCPRRFAPCEPELVPRAAASQLRNENFEMSYQLLEHMQHHTYECLRCFHCGRANFQSTDELREHMLENVSVSYIEERLAAEKFYARRWTVLYLKMLEEGLHVGPHFGPRAAAHYTSKSWCAMCRVAIKEEEVRKVFEEGENLSPFSLETSPGTTVLQTALTSPFTPASSLALARAVSASASSSSLLSPLSSSKTATHYEVMDHLCRHIAYWRYVCTLCLEQGVLAFPSVVAAAASNRRESDSEMTGNQQPPGRALTHLSIEAGLRALEEAPEARQRFLEYRRATERCCFTVVEPVAVMRHMMAYHHKNYGRQAEDAELITRWVASGPAEQYVRRSVREIINLTAAHRERNGLGSGAAHQHQQLPAALMDSHQEQERYSKLDLDWMMRQANESGWNLLIAVSTDPTLVQTLENFLASPCSTSTFAEPEQEQQWVRLIREERRLSASLRKAVRRIFPANDRNNNTGSGNHTGGGGSEYLGEVITLDDGEEGERERMRIAAATLARMAGRGGVSNNGGEDNGYEAETEMTEQHLGKGEAKKRRLLDEEDGEPNSMITEDSSSTAKSSSATTSSSSQAIVKSSSILPSPPTSLPEEEAENSRPVQTGNYRLPCFLCRIFFDITQVEVFVRHMESAHLLKKELVAGRRWAHLFAATFIKKRQREKMPLPWFEWCPMCTLLQPPSKRGVPEEDCLPTAPIRDGLIFMAADHFAQHFSYLRFRCLICDRAHQRPFEVIRDIEAIHGRHGGGCNTRQEENECLQAGNTGADFPLLFRSHIPFVNPLTVVDHLEAYHNEDYRLTNAADVIFRREMNISFLERMFLDMYRRTGNHYEPEKFIYIKEETNIYAVKMHRQSLLHKFELILVEEKFEKEYREKENYPIQRTLHHLPSQYMT